MLSPLVSGEGYAILGMGRISCYFICTLLIHVCWFCVCIPPVYCMLPRHILLITYYCLPITYYDYCCCPSSGRDFFSRMEFIPLLLVCSCFSFISRPLSLRALREVYISTYYIIHLLPFCFKLFCTFIKGASFLCHLCVTFCHVNLCGSIKWVRVQFIFYFTHFYTGRPWLNWLLVNRV